MISALIFDLDSCLAAANEVGDHLFAPAFHAIRLANNNHISEDQLRAAFADCWRRFVRVCRLPLQRPTKFATWPS